MEAAEDTPAFHQVCPSEAFRARAREGHHEGDQEYRRDLLGIRGRHRRDALYNAE